MSEESKYDALINCPNLVSGVVRGERADSVQVFWFDGSPRNIASFLMHHADADSIQITTALDMPVVTSFGCFIDQCPDPALLETIREQLVPMQLGIVSPEEFFCPTNEEFDEHCRQAQSASMTLS